MNSKTGKLSKRDVHDIVEVILGSRTQIEWGEGGCYINEDGTVDAKRVKSVQRGIAVIKRLVMTN